MKWLNHTLLTLAFSIWAATPLSAQQVVEYFWDEDPGVGCGQVLQEYTGTSAAVSAELDVSALSVGIHTLGIRALNDTWFSQTYHRQFYVLPEEEKICRIEYSWDEDPTQGGTTALNFKEGSIVDLTESLSVNALSAGMHTLYLRVLSTGHQSLTYARSFYVPPTSYAVEAIEYFFDTDPGVGLAIQMEAAIDGDSLKMAFDVNTDGLADGVHKIGIRTLTAGTWSATRYRQFLVRSVKENDITRLEYFWNEDPGQGNGLAVDITPGKEVTVDFEADMKDLPEGVHTFGIRAQSGSGGWSSVSQVTDIEFEGWDALQEYLNSLIDTEDTYTNSLYQRSFLNKDWHALYVPFSLSYSDWAAHFDVARINAFYQYDDDDDGVVDRQVLEAIIVHQGNGRLKPNHPYLIRAKATGDYDIKVDASTAVPEEINSVSCSTLEARYTFTGNYANKTGLKSASIYRLMGGALSIPNSDDEVLPPYRWYLTIDDLGNQLEESAAKVRLRIIADDTETGLDDLLIDANEMVGHRHVYDMSGRRIHLAEDAPLSTLPKGIYIINNKKCIVK